MESIEINVAGRRDEDTTSEDWHPGEPTGLLIARVVASGDKDNIHARIGRALLGKAPSGSVRVDLGHYGHEGWEGCIDFKDLRKLPDVYFTSMFISIIDEPEEFIKKTYPDFNLGEVEEEHKNAPMKYTKMQGEDRAFLMMRSAHITSLFSLHQEISTKG